MTVISNNSPFADSTSSPANEEPRAESPDPVRILRAGPFPAFHLTLPAAEDRSSRADDNLHPSLLQGSDQNSTIHSPGQLAAPSVSFASRARIQLKQEHRELTQTALATPAPPRPQSYATMARKHGCSDAPKASALPRVASSVTRLSYPQRLRKPSTREELEGLLYVARDSRNFAARLLVRSLCTEAHATSSESRGELQKLLLCRWKNPENHERWSTTLDLIQPTYSDGAEVWVKYLTQSPICPRGVRRHSATREPVLEDLECRLLVGRLRPVSHRDDKQQVISFWQTAFGMFYQKPRYREILRRLDLDVVPTTADRIIVPLEGDANSLDALATHFAACGVSIDVAEQTLHPWAKRTLDDEKHHAIATHHTKPHYFHRGTSRPAVSFPGRCQSDRAQVRMPHRGSSGRS